MGNKNFDIEEGEEPEIKTLTRAQALEIYTQEELKPTITSPWQIVRLQIALTIFFTLISLIMESLMGFEPRAWSIFFGGALGFVPSSVFMIRIQMFRKSINKGAKGFVGSLVYAQVIKVTLTLTIILFVVGNYKSLDWLSFLVMYFTSLQAYWLIGLIKMKKKLVVLFIGK